MPIGLLFRLMPLVLQVAHEAPALIKAAQDFWTAVNEHTPAPPAVQAAVQAAFHKLHEGEVG